MLRVLSDMKSERAIFTQIFHIVPESNRCGMKNLNRNEAGFIASINDQGSPFVRLTHSTEPGRRYFNGADDEIHSPKISQTVLRSGKTQRGRLDSTHVAASGYEHHSRSVIFLRLFGGGEFDQGRRGVAR